MSCVGDTLDGTSAQLVRLWVHESLRVFHDRLVDDTDREWLVGQLRVCVDTIFKTPFDEVSIFQVS